MFKSTSVINILIIFSLLPLISSSRIFNACWLSLYIHAWCSWNHNTIWNAFFTLNPWWGIVDAENKVPSADNQELPKVLLDAGQYTAVHVSPSARKSACLIFASWFIQLHFPPILFNRKPIKWWVTWTVNQEIYLWLHELCFALIWLSWVTGY